MNVSRSVFQSHLHENIILLFYTLLVSFSLFHLKYLRRATLEGGKFISAYGCRFTIAEWAALLVRHVVELVWKKNHMVSQEAEKDMGGKFDLHNQPSFEGTVQGQAPDDLRPPTGLTS